MLLSCWPAAWKQLLDGSASRSASSGSNSRGTQSQSSDGGMAVAHKGAVAAVDAEVATQEHCVFCFAVLHAHLAGQPIPEPSFPSGYCALFVTWNTGSGSSGGGRHGGGHWRLRGCIGTLEPKQLHGALHDYALTSALRDHRFSPIKLKELPTLQCKVSLLARFERASGWDDWEVGVHGIIISFVDPITRAKRSATFLPDVAPEQGWDHQQCIDALIRKAGYSGQVTSQLRQALTLERYQSTLASVTYEEYAEAIGSGAPPLAESMA